MSEPTRMRPHLPKGYLVEPRDEDMIEWAEVRALLAATRTFWLATVRPDGRPHATPIWGAWVDDAFYWDGSPETRWARNLAANPAIVVHAEGDGMQVMVEGDVVFDAIDEATLAKVADAYRARYISYVPDHREDWYIARPKLAFAMPRDMKGATKFRF